MAKYNKEIVNRICELIGTDSYTIVEICNIVGINEATYHRWKSTKSDFCKSIKKAQDNFKELITSEAKKSLVKLIKGYTVQEKRVVTADTGKRDENGKPIIKVKEHTVTDKHYQPATAAVIFALINTDPDNWKNKQNSEITGANGSDLIPNIQIEVIDKREQVINEEQNEIE